MRTLDHQGEHFQVRGPLNVARPVQGWPDIVQAGASEAGWQIAAETAEVIFTAQRTLADGQAFYADMKARVVKAGRAPEQLLILPGAFVVVGDTVAEAHAKKAKLDALVHPDSGMASVSVMLGTDASGFERDAPVPADLPDTNASKRSRAKLVEVSSRDGMTVRQLAQMLGGAYGILEFIGTPDSIADAMGQWLHENACDGFNIMFPYLPEGLDDFVDQVVPALQRRGLFRTEYEGRTLRENLGLARGANRNFLA